jgi:hypothetical protein
VSELKDYIIQIDTPVDENLPQDRNARLKVLSDAGQAALNAIRPGVEAVLKAYGGSVVDDGRVEPGKFSISPQIVVRADENMMGLIEKIPGVSAVFEDGVVELMEPVSNDNAELGEYIIWTKVGGLSAVLDAVTEVVDRLGGTELSKDASSMIVRLDRYAAPELARAIAQIPGVKVEQNTPGHQVSGEIDTGAPSGKTFASWNDALAWFEGMPTLDDRLQYVVQAKPEGLATVFNDVGAILQRTDGEVVSNLLREEGRMQVKMTEAAKGEVEKLGSVARVERTPAQRMRR